MNIDSNTKVTGIIGYPLKKTLSPLMQNTAFNALDLNWSYIPMPVKKENLGEAIKGLKALGFKGINVTMPHKEEVIKYLSEVSDYAKIAGAVNTIHFEGSKAIGYNTDGRGFLHALERDGGFSPEGKSALILGAGGAACSIAIMLAMNKIKVLTIVNRTIENAKKLANNIKSRFNDLDIKALSFSEDLPKLIDSADLIVNSTPVGWEGGLIIEPDLFHKKHLVMDL
ncbi:MAG: shikimate dehydrogenase, partial [Actinobacteria bacterium]